MSDETQCTTLDALARERMAEVGVDADESIRQLSNGPAAPLDLDGLTVESMLAAQKECKAMRLAPVPTWTDESQRHLIGFDLGSEPSRFAVACYSVETDGTWRYQHLVDSMAHMIGMACEDDRIDYLKRMSEPRRVSPARVKQRAARKVRMARKKRRGYA